jgi:phosphocarrier protein HPr
MSVSTQAVVNNKKGIHARPSSVIAQNAAGFSSTVTVFHDDKSASAKDILQLIILELFYETEVTIVADGEDENEALAKVKELIEKEYNYE